MRPETWSDLAPPGLFLFFWEVSMQQQQFNLRLDEETRSALRLIAQATERSQSSVIRWLVRREAGRLTAKQAKAEPTDTKEVADPQNN